MAPQPFVAHEIGVLIPLVFYEFRLDPDFTWLPVIDNVRWLYVPVCTGPDIYIIDEAVWSISNVRDVIRILTIIINICLDLEFVGNLVAFQDVEVYRIQLRIGGDTFLIGIRYRHPQIRTIRDGREGDIVFSQESCLEKVVQVILAPGNPRGCLNMALMSDTITGLIWKILVGIIRTVKLWQL